MHGVWKIWCIDLHCIACERERRRTPSRVPGIIDLHYRSIYIPLEVIEYIDEKHCRIHRLHVPDYMLDLCLSTNEGGCLVGGKELILLLSLTLGKRKASRQGMRSAMGSGHCSSDNSRSIHIRIPVNCEYPLRSDQHLPTGSLAKSKGQGEPLFVSRIHGLGIDGLVNIFLGHSYCDALFQR